MVLALMSCAGESARRVRLEIPARSTFRPDEFRELIITRFLIDGAPEGFDLDQEIVAFFLPEFERKLGLPVTAPSVRLENEEFIRRPSFWTALVPGSPGRLYIAGKAGLTREVRKSIRGEVPGEDPFSPQRKIVERTFFSLSLHFFLIRGDDGELLLDRDFKETKIYVDPKQRTDFAFHDLSMRIKDKFFRLILSEAGIQERYLLLK